MPAPRHLGFPSRWLLTLLIVLAGCGGRAAGSGAEVDCGTSDLRQSSYDAAAVDCFWRAFSTSKSVIWRVARVTIEGDPIPMTLSFDPATGLVATRDMTADEFSSQFDRRIWTWRCTAIKRTPWATDPSRTFFELTNCTGDGAATSFP
jgi:hypothetical protein